MEANNGLFYPAFGPMPYESIYSIYLKLSSLNCIKLSSMGYPLRVMSESQWSSHLLTRWLELNVENIDSHLPWNYASYKCLRSFTVENFRFCRECINFGYHSVFNSIYSHQVCVLHKCQLSKACSLCSKQYLQGFRVGNLIPRVIRKCNVCGFQGIGSAREMRMRHARGLLGALEEFGHRQAEWYESILGVDAVYFNKYCAQEELREYLTGPLEALTKLKSPEALAGYSVTDGMSFFFVKPEALKDHGRLYPETQAVICEKLEARHLRGHQNCLKHLNRLISYPDGTEMTIKLCAVSLAYLIFRIKGIYEKWPTPGSTSIGVAGMTGLFTYQYAPDPVPNYRSALLFFLSILGRLQHYISQGDNFALLCRFDREYLFKGESGRVFFKKTSYSFRSLCRSPSSRIRLFRDGTGGPIVVITEVGNHSASGFARIKNIIF